MNIAAIDIGTNSVRLLISEYRGSSFEILERRMDITRIGRNLDNTGLISPESAGLTAEVLRHYKKLMDKYNVCKYRAVGTNAVREASNRNWFISFIKQRTGIEVQCITGGEEACLSFCGVSASIELETPMLVIDIGGGSTEFIMGNSDLKVSLNRSIAIGSVNLSEKFIKDERPGSDQLDEMRAYIRGKIKPVLDLIGENEKLSLIGVAGTITTIAAIDLGLKEYDSSKIHHHKLAAKKVLGIYDMLCSLSLPERRRVRGLQPQRADIIIGGTAVLIEIFDMLDIDYIIVSERDILDGIIYSLAKF